jgi:hypothetical protein
MKHSKIEQKLEKDAKQLAKIKFDDLPTEDEWLLIRSEASSY